MDQKIGLSVTILGSSAAIPTKTRHLSSQVIINNNEYFLVDCGEGTQMQLSSYNIKYQRIDNIFISHLHGDHFFGLIGLISTYHLLGRDKPLNIYAPKPLEKLILSQLEVDHTTLNYELNFHYLSGNKLIKIFESNSIEVFSFPLVHRVPTYGFKFVQKPKRRNIKKEFITEFQPSIKEIQSIIKGNNYINNDGIILENESITLNPPGPVSYAYCSDTRYDESVLEFVKGVSLLYHEATFENSMRNKAYEKFHSTAGDAATIAKKAGVRKLLLGHFSARNEDLSLILKEATEVFSNSVIGEEGQDYFVDL